jgi:hypothetical protein
MDRDQWFRQVAENSLRKMNEEIRSLHRSLEIFKELEVRIEVKNQELAKTKLALQQRPHFINYYAYQLLSTRDFGGDLQWVYRLQNGTEKVLLDTAEIEPTQLRSFGLYMAFEAFLKLPEHILNELNAVYDELSVEAKTDAGKRGAVNARKQVWKEEIESFRKAKDKTPVTPYPMSAFSFESEIKKATGDATLTQKLEEFYDDFIAAIG